LTGSERCNSTTRALAQFAALPVLLCTGSIANPQPLTEDAAERIPEIVVTGSRIGRHSGDGPLPLEVYDQADLAASGVNSLQDFSRYLPLNVGIPNDEQTSASAAPGTTFFNLRGIGEQATLTLVNGRRIAAYGSAQTSGHTFVDVNSLPFAAIERIEVLKDGASAIYGSDAVAGVVNIILKQHYDGLSASAGYLTTTHDDAAETTVNLLWGTSSRAFEAIVSTSFFRRDPLVSTDRRFLADMDLRDVGGHNNRSGFSSPMTAFLPDTGRAQAEPACPTDTSHPLAYVTPIRQPHPRLDSLCTMNQKLFTHSIPATERLGLTAFAHYGASDELSVFADLLVSHVRTDSRLPPAITDRTPLPGLPFPLAEADHPGNPFGIPVAMSYSIIDAGPLKLDTESLGGRIATGIAGKASRFDWRLSAGWSESDVETRHISPVDSVLFQEALLGRGGPDRDQYYDPFGLYPENPPAVIAAFQVPQSLREDRLREFTVDGEFHGAGPELAGGRLRWVAGIQYRRQHGTTEGDDFQASGRALGIDLLRPMQAERDIGAAYFEFALPVTTALELQLAARHERYSDFGGSTHPKLALRWSPGDTIAMRASYGTSFRAPTLVELHRPAVEGQAFLFDTTRCEITAAPVDCVRFPYTTFSGGNSDLEAEEGRSWYADITWRPAAVPGFSANLAFWRFEHDQRILDVDAQFIVDEFGTDPDLVVRLPPSPLDPPGTPGPIDYVNTRPLNVQQLETQGVDLGLDFTAEYANYGRLSVAGRFTYLDEYVIEENAGSIVHLDLAGGAQLFPLPRVRGNLQFDWDHDAWRAAVLVHYTGGYRSPLNRVVDSIETDQPINVDSHVTLDLQLGYSLDLLDGASISLGCQNCADAKPPAYNYTWTGESLHDPRGAIVYARWTQEF